MIEPVTLSLLADEGGVPAMTITIAVRRSPDELDALRCAARELVEPGLVAEADRRFELEVMLDIWGQGLVQHVAGVTDALDWLRAGGAGPLGEREGFSDELNFARRIQDGDEAVPEGRTFNYCQGYVRALRWAADIDDVDPLYFGG